MLDLLWVALAAAAWCFLHSWIITLLRPGRLLHTSGYPQAASRLAYVVVSTLSLAGLILWWRSLPALTWPQSRFISWPRVDFIAAAS